MFADICKFCLGEDYFHVHLEKCWKMHIWTPKSALIQQRTRLLASFCQESQKMYLSKIIMTCFVLNFKFSSSKNFCHFVISENFAPHQTLFSSLKIAIFWRIAPQLSPHEKIRKSANVGQFYPLKTTIFYKVAPRKFHVIINIAPLQIIKNN